MRLPASLSFIVIVIIVVTATALPSRAPHRKRRSDSSIRATRRRRSEPEVYNHPGRVRAFCLLHTSLLMYECQYQRPASVGNRTSVSSAQPRHRFGAATDARAQWGIPPGVALLVLHRQNIARLEADAFASRDLFAAGNDSNASRLSALRDLDLSHNEIAFISDRAFVGIGAVEKLDLSFNNLQTFSSCSLLPLPLLRSLVLHNNHLVALAVTSHSRRHRISYFDLSYNFLQSVEARMFAVSRVESASVAINLRHNHLTTPSPEWLTLRRRPDDVAPATDVKCREINTTSPHANATSSYDVDDDDKTKSRIPTLHLVWSESNPWCCSCPLLYSFVRELHRLERGEACWNAANCSLLTDSHTGSCVRGIILPCYTPPPFRGVNLADAAQVADRFRRECCDTTADIVDTCSSDARLWTNASRAPACRFAHSWIGNSTRDCEVRRRYADGSSSNDNRATLIGIFIVISIPVFLALLPSCDKEEQADEEHLLSSAIGATLAHSKIATTTTTTSVSTPNRLNKNTVSPNHEGQASTSTPPRPNTP